MSINAVVVELIDICNLNCSYCLRDEAALHGKAHALPIPVLTRLLESLRQQTSNCEIQFTGGEPTLHPEFRLALKAVHDAGFRYAVITNGWTFSRVLPALIEFRSALSAILFSLDGPTAEEHDRVRGGGSFDRILRAIVACRANGFPFSFKVTIDRRKATMARHLAELAAELGARSIQFAPLLPTSADDAANTPSAADQEEFLQEIQRLRALLRVPIELASGFFDPRPEPTCGPLLGRTLNVDYRGRLVFCTILAGFRGGMGERDVISSLEDAPLDALLPRLDALVRARNQERAELFAQIPPRSTPSLQLGSNCLDCLASFGKLQAPLETPAKGTPFAPGQALATPPWVIAAECGADGLLLLNTRNHRFHTLNETAKLIWLLAKEGKTVEEMTAALCRDFAVEVVQARASVLAALERLHREALVAPTPIAALPPSPSAT